MADKILQAAVIDTLLNQKDVERITGLKPSTLEQWRLVGKGPRWIKLGRMVRYRESELHEYLNALPSFQSTTEADAAKRLRGGPVVELAGV